MLDTAEDTLIFLDFSPGQEDCCTVFHNDTGTQCDKPADYRVASTCDANHTRNTLMCGPDLRKAEEGFMICIVCDKVGICNFVGVLAFSPLKK